MTRRSDPRTARTHVPTQQLPDFTPVPRRNNRHDGWTPERQRAFIEALADTGSVHSACKAVDMSQPGAYYLRRQPGAESFRAAWLAALDLGVQRIEDVAMDRALNGVEVPVFAYKEMIGTRRVYNDALLMFMLRNRAPERFAEGGGPKSLNAVGKMELERKKKEWREEWEAEKKANSPTVAEVRASIEGKVQALRDQVAAEKACLTEETRAAFAHAESLKARDLARAGLGPDGDGGDAAKPMLPSPEMDSEPEDTAEVAPDPAREEEPEAKSGPRIRGLKDE